jgi:hypothetical protein
MNIMFQVVKPHTLRLLGKKEILLVPNVASSMIKSRKMRWVEQAPWLWYKGTAYSSVSQSFFLRRN